MTAKARKNNRGEVIDSGETRAAVAVTVAWMLTCMSTAAGLLVVVFLRLLMATMPAAGARHPLANVAGMLLAVAALTGVLCLLLTPVALRARRTQPPRPVVIAAMLIGAAPLVIMALSAAGLL